MDGDGVVGKSERFVVPVVEVVRARRFWKGGNVTSPNSHHDGGPSNDPQNELRLA